MSSGTSAEETSDGSAKIADDWESDNVMDLQLAQVAERQKQLAQRAAEAEQMRFSTIAAANAAGADGDPAASTMQRIGGASGSGMAKVPEAPFRLLRRPANSQHPANAARTNTINANKNRSMTMEEREAAYNEARKRIFGGGGAPSADNNDDDGTTTAIDENDNSAVPTNEETRLQPQNYLSDVEMVSAGSSSSAKSPAGVTSGSGHLPLFYRPTPFVGCAVTSGGWPTPPPPSGYHHPPPPLMTATPPLRPAGPYPLMSTPTFLPPPQLQPHPPLQPQQTQYGQPPAFVIGQPGNWWPPLAPAAAPRSSLANGQPDYNQQNSVRGSTSDRPATTTVARRAGGGAA